MAAVAVVAEATWIVASTASAPDAVVGRGIAVTSASLRGTSWGLMRRRIMAGDGPRNAVVERADCETGAIDVVMGISFR